MNSLSTDTQHFSKWLKVRVPLLSLEARRGKGRLNTESSLPQSVLLLGSERRHQIGSYPGATELADSESH